MKKLTIGMIDAAPEAVAAAAFWVQVLEEAYKINMNNDQNFSV